MSVVRTLIGNVKGPKGDTGATGATGAQGDAATIQVGTVTTGAYGTNASVTNSGTAQNAVLDFVIPQGKPGEEVTDASNLTLNEITASSADYPTFTVQERLKGIFGKIQKFLSDLKNNYVSKAMMTTSTNIGTPGQAVADAKAIKSLNDALANFTTNDIATAITDLDDVPYPAIGRYTFAASVSPSGTQMSGNILTVGTAAYRTLLLMTNSATAANQHIYYNTRNANNGWAGWRKVTTTAP